jgi:hypothetical protein
MPDQQPTQNRQGSSGGGATASGLIGGGLSLINSALNRRHINKINESNIKEENRRRQEDRQWSLEDIDAMNAYNDPKQQMNRYRQAGLNPNLIYGKGADSTTTMARGTTTSDVNQQASPSVNPAPEALQAYLAVKQNQAMTDQVYQNIALAKAEENLKQLTSSNMAIRNAYDQNSLEQARKLNDSVILKANLENQTMQANIQVMLGKYELDKMANASNIAKTVQDIAKSKQDILTQHLQNATLPLQKQKIEQEIRQLELVQRNTDLDRQIKEIELENYRNGIQKNDNIFYRNIWKGIMENSNETSKQNAEWKKTTYGGRPGFDADGNPQSQFDRMMKPDYYK